MTTQLTQLEIIAALLRHAEKDRVPIDHGCRRCVPNGEMASDWVCAVHRAKDLVAAGAVKPPMQPIVMVGGVARFLENRLVRWLVDQVPMSLNTIAAMDATPEEHSQLAQLIGWSVSGYGGLPDPVDVAAADVIVEALLAGRPQPLTKNELVATIARILDDGELPQDHPDAEALAKQNAQQLDQISDLIDKAGS